MTPDSEPQAWNPVPHVPQATAPQSVAAPVHPRSLADPVRVGLVVLVMVAVATGLGMTLVSLNSIIDIWFKAQWQPIARLVAGLALLAVALYALRLLMTRGASLRKDA